MRPKAVANSRTGLRSTLPVDNGYWTLPCNFLYVGKHSCHLSVRAGAIGVIILWGSRAFGINNLWDQWPEGSMGEWGHHD